jgi:hypothetical protein
MPRPYPPEFRQRALDLVRSGRSVPRSRNCSGSRALKDLNRNGKGNPPEWARRMAARHRKTLVVCRACHEGIHSGSPPRQT